MKDLKRAFGSPDPEFQSRVRQTLFRIEEKEETIVKKKLTFSMAMAMILCICIITVSALAGSALLTEKPDVTRPPLSHSENENPNPSSPAGTISPDTLLLIDEVYWPEGADFFHLDERCRNMSYPCTVLTLSGALEAGGRACPLCFTGLDGFASLPELVTPTPQPTAVPALTPVPEYLHDMTTSLIAQSTEVFLLNADDSIYHLDSSCGGTDHPYMMNLLSAVWMGCTACTECVGDGGWFYTSETDPYFHPSADCCVGMDRPLRVTLIEAYALEKIPCNGQSGAPAFVWSAEGDDYYHAHSDCSAAHKAARVTLPVAENRRQAPCLICWFSGSAHPTLTPMPTSAPIASSAPVYVWSAEGDSHYHTAPDCERITGGAIRVTLAVAQNRSQTDCPLCRASDNAHPTLTPMPAHADIDIPLVYAAQDLSTFHYISSSACAENDGILIPLPLTDALNEGARPCRECITCWIGEDSELYHMSESCVRLSSPQIQLVSEAVASGRHPCGVCVCFWDMNNAKHHRFAHCSAFGDGTNAYIPCPLDFPYLVGSTPCELCVSSPRTTPVPLPTNEPNRAELTKPGISIGSDRIVFLWDSDAPVYHSVYNCSGYEYLYQMELSDAAEKNLTPCPLCVLGEAIAADLSIGDLPPAWSTGDSEFYFYDYSNDHSGHFHTGSSCSTHPMVAPIAISLETAIRYELHPCPACTNLLDYVIIGDPNVKYYHISDECQPFSAPEYITRYEAKKLRLESCPLCAAEEAASTPTVSPSTPTPMPQETPSSNAVYPSRSGDSLFHRKRLCGETVTAPSVSLIDALNTGLLPCPDCYGNESVYTVNGGETYHHPENPCFRFYASSSYFGNVSLAEALLRGKTPCEECVLLPAEDDDFTIFFYTEWDEDYHLDSSCASENDSSLLAAYERELIAMGKNPCKKCMPPEAYGYVFSSESGAFYHLYDDCVGADVPAPRVPISVAKARLQTACPNCTGDPDYVCLITDTSAFYHIKDVLNGVPDAVSLSRAVTVKEAHDAGKNPCICMGLGASSEKTTRECRADLIGEVYYYSVNGEYYHLESVCGINEYPDLLRGAQVHEKNLSPCPACLPNRQKTNSIAASVDNAVSHGVILSDEEAASSAR